VAVYKLDVVSFDSVSLQTSDLEAWFKPGDGIIDTFPAQNVDVGVPGTWPQRVDVQYTGKAFPVHIRLKDTTSTKLLALQKLFRGGQGVKILRCTDGAGTTLRLSCESLGLLSTDNPVEFVARLWAVKPLWENDTATTSEHLHCAGDTHPIPLVNNGSAPAKPVITVKFNAAKKQAAGPAFFRYRCLPNICTNALTDPDGAGYPTLVKSGLDTATLIKNTAIYNLLNGAIDASVTTINIDGAVGGGLPTTPGMAMVGTEQIYYAANSGTQLTGCIRGIGGTTAATHADNVPIYASKTLANGNDFLVWVDGVSVDRWFGTGSKAWNTASTSIWANIPWVARRVSYLKNDITNAQTEIEFTTDLSTWPAAGYFMMIPSTGDEVMSYSSRLGKIVYGVKRAQRGTTAAAQSENCAAAVMEHDIRYSYGDEGAGAPPADTDLKPMIDLGVSTWTKQAWPTDYREDATLRSAQWQQGYENANALCVKLRGFEADSKMQVEDALPEAGKPNRNTWSIALPAGCTLIHHDVSVPANMLLQVWGDDGEALKLLKEYTSANDGDGEEITPTATIYGLQYRALVRTVTGAEPSATGSLSYAIGNTSNKMAQYFTLDQSTTIQGISVTLLKDAAADGNVVLNMVRGGTAGDPDTGEFIVVDVTLAAVADIGLTATVCTLFFENSLTVPAGDYHFNLHRSGSAGNIWLATYWTSYSKGSIFDETAAVWAEYPGKCARFRILGDGSVCQPEVPSGTGEECTIDDIELTLTTPFPAVSALSEASCYLWEALLTLTHADATVQTLSLLVPAEVGQEMEIDCEAQTVINKTTGESVAFGITASDKGWLDVISATDSLTYAEVGMVDTDVTVVLRDTYAA